MSEETENRDWVGDAVKCFIAVDGLDPTDPVSAIQAHFDRTATDELKAECAANGKTAAGCWKFIEAVARRALNGRNGHIDPTAVYAIAMHWFQDVPVDWDRAKTASAVVATESNGYRSKPEKSARPKKPAKPNKTAKPKKKYNQGFFFDLLETKEVADATAEA